MDTQEKIVAPITNQSTPPTTPVPTQAQSSVVDTQLAPDAPLSEVEKLIPQESYKTSPLFYEVANFFSIDEADYDNAKNDLSEIVDHAIMETKSNKIEDILTFLKNIENKLRISSWNEKRYKDVYRYVRLTSKRSALDKAIKAYEKGDING